MKPKRKEFRESQVIRVHRRVLRLLDTYLAEQNQDKLTAGGGGFMTWGELRQHVHGALSLRAAKGKGK